MQPPITDAGIQVGPHWAEAHYRHVFVRPTVGVAAYSHLGGRFGVELGVAYRQDGREWVCGIFCALDNEDPDRGRSFYGYLDASVLARLRLVGDDRSNLHVVLGPKWGAPVTCRSKNITQGTERDCDAGRRDFDLRIVVGAGVTFQATRSLNLTAGYRYSLDPREIPVEEDGDADMLAMTLVAGIAYRLDLRR